ncbi:hypothetical protein A1F94_013330 [Pyrenophora tritici-repentis]|uniref:Uncharacterized protein n=1 Tax=Pyrenophora tritici-repentis TaxID=45151 RepID=A0A2W1CUE7_9PLEO|nr:hypothetical protein A1F94_013330 [Pyrenophora tritici-repentis]KAI0574729.1 hypothetical protein Alg130_09558 [Pyrenophora tritici-repentis]KAI0606224.1 hypothetical protein TUN205_09535 [Pyrenophora tritici-repentis]KAI0617407.1 hypothetical protein TUN199_10604 [Pyrenophora tritici-repentis]KAI1509527.1 hypothetical protein Ptr86124_011607 [Pyrenophora tritici-repentis]
MEKARIIANGITLNQLKSLLGQDSAADISGLLEQEAVSYPIRVQGLTKSFGPTEKTISSDPPSKVATGLLDLQDDDSVKVIHPLHQSVLAIAQVAGDHDEPLSHAL